MKYIVVLILLALAAWFAWGFYVSKGIKRPVSVVEEKLGNIEKRRIGPMITASVLVPGTQGEGLNQGFRILAGYIFGGNTTRESVAMTAPVISQKQSASIAMTAPVTSKQVGDMQEVSFVMPAEYTLDTLPIADDDSIVFAEQKESLYYVWKFGGFANEGRAEKQRVLFETELADLGLSYTGAFQLAQYNDPWTPPMMRENEWWVSIDGDGE